METRVRRGGGDDRLRSDCTTCSNAMNDISVWGPMRATWAPKPLYNPSGPASRGVAKHCKGDLGRRRVDAPSARNVFMMQSVLDECLASHTCNIFSAVASICVNAQLSSHLPAPRGVDHLVHEPRLYVVYGRRRESANCSSNYRTYGMQWKALIHQTSI